MEYQTTGQDLFNAIAQGYNSNSIMQYVIYLHGKINYEILQKAVRLSFTQEPVLGCKFRSKPVPAWEPINEKDASPICRKVSAGDTEKAVNAFLEKELSPEDGAQVSVCLICGGENDILCVKICHAACDGCGSKYYISLLASLYTQIAHNPNDQPEPASPERSTGALYSNLGIYNPKEYFNPKLAEENPTWGFRAESNAEPSRFQYKLQSLNEAEFTSLHKYAKERKTTINSILAAAYYSALLQTLKETEEKTKEIQIMIDLRKYLPESVSQAICNLSSSVNIDLPVDLGNDMGKLIPLITKEMERVKAEKPFIHGAIGVDLAAETGFDVLRQLYHADWEHIQETGNCTPMLSNLGVLSAEPVRFAEAEAYQVDYVSPAFNAPAVMLGACTYCSRLTLCVSYYSPEISGQKVESLLNLTADQLKKLIPERHNS